MKNVKLFYFLFLIFSLFFYSCSNDDEYENSLPNMNSKSAPVIDNIEELFKLFDIAPKISVKASPGVAYFNGIEYKSLAGYDNIRRSTSSRVMFTSEMAKHLGLFTNRVYQIHIKYVTKKVPVPNGYIFFENTSSECGYSSTNESGVNTSKRGYQFSSESANIALTTHLLFIECDEWGGSKNKSYPCDASQLKWNYILWKN